MRDKRWKKKEDEEDEDEEDEDEEEMGMKKKKMMMKKKKNKTLVKKRKKENVEGTSHEQRLAFTFCLPPPTQWFPFINNFPTVVSIFF